MKSYADNLTLLTVLVTHLGTCKLKSKSASKLADDLSLEKEAVANALAAFPELFVETGQSKHFSGEKTFTLHLRYALRWTNKNDDGDEVKKPIESEHLSALLSFIDSRVAQENAASRQKIANGIAIAAAVVAAIAAIVAAIIANN